MNPDATIIIPQRNREELTLACLQSLRQFETDDWPVLVIDDGSAPGAARFLETMSPRVTLLRQPARGLTAAWNLARKFVRTPLVVFLNNDVIWKGPALSRLLAPLRDNNSMISATAERYETSLPGPLLDQLPTRRFAEGWCFALRRADLNRVGGFDDTMPLYWSDTDLQLRLLSRWQADREEGRAVPPVFLSVVDLPLLHLGHQTAHRVPGHRLLWQRDRRVFLGKWLQKVRAKEFSETQAISEPQS